MISKLVEALKRKGIITHEVSPVAYRLQHRADPVSAKYAAGLESAGDKVDGSLSAQAGREVPQIG
jgi:hypothetical protein